MKLIYDYESKPDAALYGSSPLGENSMYALMHTFVSFYTVFLLLYIYQKRSERK